MNTIKKSNPVGRPLGAKAKQRTKIRKKPSKKNSKPSVEQIKEKLFEHCGIITYVAEDFNVAPNTLRKYIDASATLQQALIDSRNKLVDTAEHKLLDNIKSGKETSIIFTLKCLAKQRGYEDRTTLDVNQTIQQIIINVDSADTKQLLENFNLKQIQQNNPKLLDENNDNV